MASPTERLLIIAVSAAAGVLLVCVIVLCTLLLIRESRRDNGNDKQPQTSAPSQDTEMSSAHENYASVAAINGSEYVCIQDTAAAIGVTSAGIQSEIPPEGNYSEFHVDMYGGDEHYEAISDIVK